MDILRIALIHAPEKTLKVIGKINKADTKILNLNKKFKNRLIKLKKKVAVLGVGEHQKSGIKQLRKIYSLWFDGDKNAFSKV